MCGFAGIINMNGEPVDASVIINMTEIISHRGPDDSGIALFSAGAGQYVELQKHRKYNDIIQPAAIGFKRLSILDLTDRGHQPMYNKNRNAFIVFNGEVYNAFDYKNDLKQKGYVFKSDTDTEVLLYLYFEYGIEGMLSRLNGMFAFFIGDLRNKVSFLARDHFGIKPMYYYLKDNVFLFGSEIKSFLKHPDFRPDIETSHLPEHILYRYNSDDRTLFKNVKQLPPAHYLKIGESTIDIKKYWEPSLSNVPISESNALLTLDDLLKSSVKSQLLSDVKVGCQLSGGIDSSLVTTYARDFFDANMDTFSIVFGDKQYSEEPWINLVTNQTQSDSHRYMFDADYVIANLFSATWHLDVPMNLPNTIGIKKLAELSKQNVSVLLSGEGADELMGGYHRFYDLIFRNNNKSFLKLLSRLPFARSKIENKYQLAFPIDNYIILNNAAITRDQFNSVFPGNDINQIIYDRKSLLPLEGDLLKRAIVYELRTHLVDLLNRQDKMTMAHSLENRVPFLDRTLVDFILSLPPELLVSGTKNIFNYNRPNNYSKHLLKKLTVQKYGAKFAYRSKNGFPLPIESYFNNDFFVSLMNEKILPGIRQRNLFSIRMVETIWGKANKTKNDYKILWMFLSFEIWAQIFIDRIWQE